MRFTRYYLSANLIVLAVTEFLLLLTSVHIAKVIQAEPDLTHSLTWADGFWSSLLFAAVLVAMFVSMGLYDRRVLSYRVQRLLPQMSIGYVMGLVILAVIYWIAPSLHLGRGEVALAFAISFVALLLVRHLTPRITSNKAFQHRILVLGTGLSAAKLSGLFGQSAFPGSVVVGFVDAPGEQVCVEPELVLKKDSTLLQLALENHIDEIVVALEERRQCVSMAEVLECRTHSIRVTSGSDFVERELGSIRIDDLLPSTMIFSDGFNYHRFSDGFKRVYDILISSLLLVSTLPIFVLAGLAIWFEEGFRGPIFYIQERVGKDGKTFNLIKFRSMITEAEGDGVARWAQPDDDRVTRVGRIIRNLRIDELPQLYNVLMGNMSLVGPRPERPEFVSNFAGSIPYYHIRHSVKPGITGWAQVRYPYGASEEDAREKLQYDLYYVKNYSVLFDVLVLLQTAYVIMWRNGVR